MATQARTAWLNNIPYTFDKATGEWLWRPSPVTFEDEFLGNTLDLVYRWETVETLLNTAPALVDDASNGVAQITLNVDNDTEKGVLYMNDNLQFALDKGVIWQARVNFPVLPTSTTEMVLGLAATEAAFDSITTSCWFKLAGSGALLAESDDTSTNNDDKATGVTLLNTDWAILRIDATTLADVKFYVNGVRVASSTTFDMSSATGAAGKVQPYFGAFQSDASVGTLYIDNVRIWQDARA